MSKYTSKEVDTFVENASRYLGLAVPEMLTEYATLLRERESAKAGVTEREALEAIKRLPARPFPDPVAHSWEAFGRAVMGAFTDAKFIAIRALAAAPKPETEE